MPQSNVIFGFVFAAFLIFITARGELPKYGAVFFGSASGGGGNTPSPSGTSGGSSVDKATGAIDKAKDTVDGIASGLNSVNKLGATVGKLLGFF